MNPREKVIRARLDARLLDPEGPKHWLTEEEDLHYLLGRIEEKKQQLRDLYMVLRELQREIAHPEYERGVAEALYRLSEVILKDP